jgi:predicted PurR-regulated permease PerM
MLSGVATPERMVSVRPRTVLAVLGLILLVFIVLAVIWASRGVVGWILVAIFLAMALDPAVVRLERQGIQRGPAAVGVFLLALVVIGGLAYLLVPPIVDQVREFSKAVPELVNDLVKGRGPLGFLERDYQIVERIRSALEGQGVSGFLGFTGLGLHFARGVLTVVVAVITIAFLTLFMLIDGRRLLAAIRDALPERSLPRWERVWWGVYRTVGGYVSGNLLISVIAGGLATAVLFATGTPYALSLGIVVALFDLVPLAGATIAAVIVILVALATKGWVIALVLGVFFLVYQQVENHLIQPLVYRRTVQLSAVVVLCSVLIGADLAGVLGALGAIPIAGSIQVVLGELLAIRRERAAAGAATETPPAGGSA